MINGMHYIKSLVIMLYIHDARDINDGNDGRNPYTLRSTLVIVS